jgi:hypothetical protein
LGILKNSHFKNKTLKQADRIKGHVINLVTRWQNFVNLNELKPKALEEVHSFFLQKQINGS